MADLKSLTVSLPGIHCSSCGFLIEDELASQVGVAKVEVDLPAKEASILYHQDLIGQEQILETINRLGDYRPEIKS